MTPLIQIEHLSKNFRGTHALDDLTLSLEGGRIVGLLGENGSGKTTLLKILAGLLMDYQGSVRISGHQPGAATKKLVSYLPDTSAIPTNLTVTQAVDLYARFFADFDRSRAQEMIDFFELPQSKRISELSLGTAEKLQILLAIARQAQIYLLDEPLSGIDPASRERILRGILTNFSENALMLVSTHLIHDIEPVIDQTLFIRQGRLILNQETDALREEYGKSLEGIFKEVYA